jgi:hypothetical protein
VIYRGARIFFGGWKCGHKCEMTAKSIQICTVQISAQQRDFTKVHGNNQASDVYDHIIEQLCILSLRNGFKQNYKSKLKYFCTI